MTDNDNRVKEYITRLVALTQGFLHGMPEAQFKAELKSIKELFDSFAIINEFTSSLIADCYNELKISLKTWERFADKTAGHSVAFKRLLEQMFAVMDDLYQYEIFGFFSTSIVPKALPELHLPCRIFCGCMDFWPREPYLTEDGKAAYENVIRFEDPNTKAIFCMTISDTPRLLEDRNTCTLTDEQIDRLKNFVKKNKDIITLHCADYLVIDSGDLFTALNVNNFPKKYPPTYRLAYRYSDCTGTEEIPSEAHYVAMNDMPYEKAKIYYKKLQDEIQHTHGNNHGAYELRMLEVLDVGKRKN